MSSDSKLKILREGERYVQQGKISLAINEYLKIVRIDPEDVLTLNTIGDLYLRQGRVSEANQLFLQVAQRYTSNNFLLKSIAVYKKILKTDPHNLEVNALVASLFARQGMNVDARNQYVLIADLCARQGKTQDSLEAFEKVVEIDPSNASVQLKLAESYLSLGQMDKAHRFFVGAARSQIKSGDVSSSMQSFRRALDLKPGSPEALQGLLETALPTGEIGTVLQMAEEFLDGFPADPGLAEALGRAHLAAGNIDKADLHFVEMLKKDESCYEPFLPLSVAYLDAGDPDRALTCLDPIVPTLITRRETRKCVEAYDRILSRYPGHVATMRKLADIFSATNDYQNSIAALEKLAQHLVSEGNAGDALEPLEKILHIIPDSESHRERHREAFEQAFPGTPYKLPRSVLEAAESDASRHLEPVAGPAAFAIKEGDSTNSAIVEIDLLLNYGMREKALELLRTLESQTPMDKEVRIRLASIYRETEEPRLAAEQYVLLSALYRKSGDSEAAKKTWEEARNLDPAWANQDLDVVSFAQKHRISLDGLVAEEANRERSGNLEVDLSGDLSEIFFKDAPMDMDPDEIPDTAEPDPMADEFLLDIPHSAVPESVEEQLQEVDFYVRLGFHDEARAKLDEIAAAYPNHPALEQRYQQLDREPALGVTPSLPLNKDSLTEVQAEDGRMVEASHSEDLILEKLSGLPGEESLPEESAQPGTRLHGRDMWAGRPEDPVEGSVSVGEPSHEGSAPQPQGVLSPADPATPGTPPNSMFADLLEELNMLTDREIEKEDFETHFGLGIAYREMGLVDDAVKEFQNALKGLDAAKSPKEVIQCCGMLSTCFLEKGMHRSAIRWCQTGLAVNEISSHESMALRYDMGVAHSSAGDTGPALECFGSIFDIDPSYRDVAQRIDDLKSGYERHAP